MSLTSRLRLGGMQAVVCASAAAASDAAAAGRVTSRSTNWLASRVAAAAAAVADNVLGSVGVEYERGRSESRLGQRELSGRIVWPCPRPLSAPGWR